MIIYLIAFFGTNSLYVIFSLSNFQLQILPFWRQIGVRSKKLILLKRYKAKKNISKKRKHFCTQPRLTFKPTKQNTNHVFYYCRQSSNTFHTSWLIKFCSKKCKIFFINCAVYSTLQSLKNHFKRLVSINITGKAHIQVLSIYTINMKNDCRIFCGKISSLRVFQEWENRKNVENRWLLSLP